jgi:purine-binding chemotaxis protein CheW
MNTDTNPGDTYVVFSLDEQLFALRLSAVERVVLAVEVTALPHAPEIVLGVINVRGQITPVFDLRKRFRLPAREIDLSDQFIIARTRRRQVALVVDGVRDVGESLAQQTVAADEILPGLGLVEGVAKLGGDLIFIHNLDKFLSLEEERELEGVLETSFS